MTTPPPRHRRLQPRPLTPDTFGNGVYAVVLALLALQVVALLALEIL